MNRPENSKRNDSDLSKVGAIIWNELFGPTALSKHIYPEESRGCYDAAAGLSILTFALVKRGWFMSCFHAPRGSHLQVSWQCIRNSSSAGSVNIKVVSIAFAGVIFSCSDDLDYRYLGPEVTTISAGRRECYPTLIPQGSAKTKQPPSPSISPRTKR